MQLEDNTFLEFTQKMIDMKAGVTKKAKSAAIERLRKAVDYRKQNGDQQEYVYICGFISSENVTLRDFEEIIKELDQ